MSNSIQFPSKGQDRRPDVYQIVTNQVIELLEDGQIPWQKPWRGGAAGMPKNAASQKPYRGINVFMLAMTAEFKGYDSPFWLTYKQAQQLGGSVRKGEKASLVVFWKQVEKDNPEDPQNPEKFPVLRYYRVFNADQCEGVEVPDLEPEEETPVLDFRPIEACERVVRNYITRPNITHKEPQAYYSPSRDIVNMPEQWRFTGIEEYYATLFHELTHSTGHPRRLRRHENDKHLAFGSTAYSKEELVAEMGAAFLCGMCEIENRTIENSAAYIQGWLRKLKSDKKLVVQAAAQAQKASDYILGE